MSRSTDYERLVSHIEAALPVVHRFAPPTPVLRLRRLDALIEGDCFPQSRMFTGNGIIQGSGGAQCDDTAQATQSVTHVVAFSSGNHGIGVAYAAKCLKMSASVVVPE